MLLATTPLASVTLLWVFVYVALTVGLPLIVIVLPLKLAVSPLGNPLCVSVPNGPVPSLIVTALL